jgi:3-methylcrotonyl-CoA carboxylase alpha subunit
MIAKLIAHGRDRGDALSRLAAALGDTVVVGPHANAAFLKALVSNAEFRAGRFDTGFIDRNLAALTEIDPATEAAVIGAAVAALLQPHAHASDGSGGPRNVSWSDPWSDPWSASDGFSLGPARELDLAIVVGGQPKTAHVIWQGGPQVMVDGVPAAREGVRIVPAGRAVVVIGAGVQRTVALKSYESVDVDHLDGDGVIKAPMHGKVLAILVEAGANVQKGQRVAVVEAMKMEHALLAPHDGVVGEVTAEVGAQVAEGATILSIETQAAD